MLLNLTKQHLGIIPFKFTLYTIIIWVGLFLGKIEIKGQTSCNQISSNFPFDQQFQPISFSTNGGGYWIYYYVIGGPCSIPELKIVYNSSQKDWLVIKEHTLDTRVGTIKIVSQPNHGLARGAQLILGDKQIDISQEECTVTNVKMGMMTSEYFNNLVKFDVNGYADFERKTITYNSYCEPEVIIEYKNAQESWLAVQHTLVNHEGSVTVTCQPNYGFIRSAQIRIGDKNIYINQEGGRFLIDGPASLCARTKATYTINPIEGAVKYDWHVPSGMEIIAGQNSNSIEVIAENPGTYEIYAWASDANGWPDDAFGKVMVNVNPSSGVSVTNNLEDPVCLGTSVTLTGKFDQSDFTGEIRWYDKDNHLLNTGQTYTTTINNETTIKACSYNAQNTCEGGFNLTTIRVKPQVTIETELSAITKVSAGVYANMQAKVLDANLIKWQKSTDGINFIDTDQKDYYFNLYAVPNDNGAYYRYIAQNTCNTVISNSTKLEVTLDQAHCFINGIENIMIWCSLAAPREVKAIKSVTLLPGFSTNGNTFHASVINGKVYTPNLDVYKNYVHTIIPKEPHPSVEPWYKRSTETVSESVEYLDGLGRVTQHVDINSSPSLKDMVQPYEYDANGRVINQYLPYTKDGNGYFDKQATRGTDQQYQSSNQYQFYQVTAGITTDTYPYAKTEYDNSPLNKVIKQGAPGSAWQPDQHPVGFDYLTNVANEVSIWRAEGNKCIKYGSYEAGKLFISVVVDENCNKTKSYQNQQGQSIYKVTEAKDGSLVTKMYYVYDDFGLLRYILPPMAVDNIGQLTTLQPDDDFVKKWCFYYEYNNKHRIIGTKVPGADPLYNVYDNKDRVVLSQDGEQRKTNQWSFVKYDILNRPVLVGLTIIPAKTRDQIQSDFTAYTGALYETIASGTIGYTTNNSFSTLYSVSESDLLGIDYYDNYNYPGVLLFDDLTNISGYTDKDGDTRYFERLSGLNTGKKTKVLGTSIWLTSSFYYNDKYQLIQRRKDLYDGSNGGKESITCLYDFIGQIKQVKQRQTFGAEITTVEKWFTYDHAGRLTKTEQQINEANRTTISELTYNELGQVQQKKLGSSQEMDYKYNIRGWLTQINDPASPGSDLFSMKLLYNNKDAITGLTSDPQFNGNISGMIVNRKDNFGNSSTTYGYGFNYDALNRLTASDYGEGTGFTTNADKYNEFGIKYDANGNILSLQRNNGSLVDNLSYTYKSGSNQLESVTDGSANSTGFKDVSGTDYSYDANGNLTKENNKGIASITYNLLNLPNVLSKDVSNDIKYVYDATGIKLCKEVKIAGITTKRWYCGSMEYDNNMALSVIHTNEGMVEVTTSGSSRTYNYAYYLKDHLDNTRVVFNQNGALLQRTDYYPFGMTSNTYSSSTDNKYLYNGQELQQDLALDWYDYGARYYDPVIGRWYAVDPLSFLAPGWSPYRAFFDNPLYWRDPTGLFETRKEAREYKKEHNLQGRVRLNQDGSYSIDNREEHTSIYRDNDYGIQTAVLIEAKRPDSKAITPWGLGVEWLSGEGARSRSFGCGDNITEMYKQHEHFDQTKQLVIDQLAQSNGQNTSSGSNPYELKGIEGVGKYIQDYSTLATGGQTGNLVYTYLGSHSLQYEIKSVDIENRMAEVTFLVHNTSTMQSATRLPVVGYQEWYRNSIGVFTNWLFSSGPGSETEQWIEWTESIEW